MTVVSVFSKLPNKNGTIILLSYVCYLFHAASLKLPHKTIGGHPFFSVDLLDLRTLSLAFDSHGFVTASDQQAISVTELRTLLVDLHNTVRKQNPRLGQMNSMVTAQLTLNLILNLYDM